MCGIHSHNIATKVLYNSILSDSFMGRLIITASQCACTHHDDTTIRALQHG
jgi:hypothetical protein